MKPEDLPTYCEACWETFRETFRPDRLTCSSAEFELARRWFMADVPLPVVERGIRETSGKPRTLLACEGAVARAYSYWRDAMGIWS